MNMTGMSRYMYLSQALDLKLKKDRWLRLPNGDVTQTVLMVEKRAATFSAACSRRVISAGF